MHDESVHHDAAARERLVRSGSGTVMPTRCRGSVLDVMRSLPLVLGLLVACVPASRPINPDLEAPSLAEVTEPPESEDAMGEQAQLELLASLYLDERARHGVLERALAQRASETTRTTACEAPSMDELSAARAQLFDFRVLEARGGKLLARVPNASELDDLAYLMVAVSEAGPRVGLTWTNRASPRVDELAPELEKLQKAWDEAIARADLETAYVAGRHYLELLGWPGAIRINDDFGLGWGGAAHSFLMRDMAMIAEVRGDHEQARLLYTRASPGGGTCGHSVRSRWEDQVRGSIRTGEQLYGCRAVIAERLLDVDGRIRDDYDYGPSRLVDAGFDLGRLYRGALLTRNRHEVSTTLAQTVIGSQREVAVARLSARGSEAWEARLQALEGFTDMMGDPALDVLLELIAVGDPNTRARAIGAIGQAARREFAGPCDRTFFLGRSTRWTIRAFGEDCATRLDDAEAAKLAARLRPHLHDRDPDVREATIEALQLILAAGETQ
jgi:hypothetical protein